MGLRHLQALHVNVLSGGVYFCTDANFKGNCVCDTVFKV